MAQQPQTQPPQQQEPPKPKRRFIDVWIVETNTVYREVPFAVVTDWIQQGRLLSDDRVRPSGTAEWFPIGGSATFSAYVPKMEANRAEDQAEALEKVEIDFAWKRRRGEDDDEVDMIPLIDVTLVLLIFFMMSRDISGGRPEPPPKTDEHVAKAMENAVKVDVPAAEAKKQLLKEDIRYWVAIKPGGVGKENVPRYSWGVESLIRAGPMEDPQQLIDNLDGQVKDQKERIPIRIRADKNLSIDIVKDMIQRLEATRKFEVYAEVR